MSAEISEPSALSVIMPPDDGAAATREPDDPESAVAPVGAEAATDGTTKGLVLVRSGISIGMSTAIGLGWVSNRSGKPITPKRTSTAAPSRRWRARRRMASTLSAGAGGTLALRPSLAGPRARNLKNAMKFDP
ncbi:MAG: hypothetical protein V4636_01265 [Pseudomonadota bacterium]